MSALVTVEGRFPSLNDYVDAERANRFLGSKMKREQTERVAAAALSQGARRVPGPVTVRFLWVEPNRRRDLDNVAFAKKFVLDGLVAAGVIDGDDQRHVKGLQDVFEVDPTRPRVVVEVSEAW